MTEPAPRAFFLHRATIIKLKTDRKCSWKAVARACGVHEGTVKKWVAGTQAPMSRHLEKLAIFFNCTKAQLTGEKPYPARNCDTIPTPHQTHSQPGGDTKVESDQATLSAEIQETPATLQLTVFGDKKSWSEGKLTEIYEFMVQHLKSKGFAPDKERIVYKSVQFSSVILRFEMPDEWARELLRAAKNKELIEAGIVDVEIMEVVDANSERVAAKVPSQSKGKLRREIEARASLDRASSPALLELLDPDAGEESRQRLDDLCRPLLLPWLNRVPGLRETAEELVQEPLVLVHREFTPSHHRRSGSFRRWLRIMTANFFAEYVRSQRRQRPSPRQLAVTEQELAQLTDDQSDASQFWDEEHDKHVMDYLLKMMANEFGEVSIRVFQRHMLEGASLAQVAQEFGMSKSTVLRTRTRILKRMRELGKGLLD